MSGKATASAATRPTAFFPLAALLCSGIYIAGSRFSLVGLIIRRAWQIFSVFNRFIRIGGFPTPPPPPLFARLFFFRRDVGDNILALCNVDFDSVLDLLIIGRFCIDGNHRAWQFPDHTGGGFEFFDGIIRRHQMRIGFQADRKSKPTLDRGDMLTLGIHQEIDNRHRRFEKNFA